MRLDGWERLVERFRYATHAATNGRGVKTHLVAHNSESLR